MKIIKLHKRLLILLLLAASVCQAQINKAEYFFDTDPGAGNGTNITLSPGADINFAFNPSIASLSNGLHRLFVRAQQADGSWSITQQQLIYKETVVTTSLPNIVKMEWFIDTDTGYHLGGPVAITAATDVTQTFTVPVPFIPYGLHRLFVRALDASGNWSIVAQQLFYREAYFVNSTPNITKAEYFIDTDPGLGNATDVPVTAGTDISFAFNPSIASIGNGLHRLFVRTRDADGKWSLIAQQLFYKEGVITNPVPNITKAEFFFDADPGFGNGTDISIAPGADIVFNFTGNIASLSNGLHRLFVRTRDADGRWSLTSQQLFYKEAVVSSPIPNITKAEFFFDSDPGFGNGTDISLTAGADITFGFNGAISSLGNGLHRLFVRTQDANGKWSLTAQQLFYKEAVVNNPLVNLVQAEYYFDTDPGFGNATAISLTTGQDILINFSGDISALGNGLHRLFVRTKDADGKWGLTSQQLFYKEPIVTSAATNLVTLEYFWDTDPGFGNATRVTLPANSGEVSNYVFNVTTPAALSNGRHNLFIRVIDATDWSLTTVKMVDFTGIILPVTLLDFSARAVQDKVAVKWITTNEVNNKHFEVERSVDGISFIRLGTVAARGNGATTQTAYDFTDASPVTGMNYYRLKQVDLDGRFTYSPVVAIRFDKAGYLVQLYPNPATSYFTIRSDKKFRTVELTDMNGKLIQNWTIQSNNRYMLSNVAKGMYVVKLIEENGGMITKSLLIDK